MAKTEGTRSTSTTIAFVLERQRERDKNRTATHGLGSPAQVAQLPASTSGTSSLFRGSGANEGQVARISTTSNLKAHPQKVSARSSSLSTSLESRNCEFLDREPSTRRQSQRLAGTPRQSHLPKPDSLYRRLRYCKAILLGCG